ncbi:hypothetical protein KFK14_10035 [Sphingobium phenoxybenzoativorans]|uniref:Uncharacterized protein n=1 Tax=Sphingobium phenoxybenzoativorans TaxID=1592790 RepID=A0A975Q358_9SPHN|nr:hypothetical protein [Sphingobium phenoxybenzoativorans]QUT07690.1 hypothetical protein KFK14_10035 [Sphingobium phenoxybenzoativorans]
MTRSVPPYRDNRCSDQPVRHSRRFSDEIVEEACRVFQKRTDRQLTHEDGRQILENLVGFFSTLHEWDHASAKTGHEDGPAISKIPGSDD